MAVPFVMAGGEAKYKGDKATASRVDSHARRPGQWSPEQFEFVLVGARQLDAVTGRECQEILAVDM